MRFARVQGVVRTLVGYTGGNSKWPTYRRMKDHTETVQIYFDPTIISYERLLDIYWNSVNPKSNYGSKQYMDAIFYQPGTNQKELIQKSVAEMERQGILAGQKVATRIDELGPFYLAEGYHQKYLDRDLLNKDEWLRNQIYK